MGASEKHDAAWHGTGTKDTNENQGGAMSDTGTTPPAWGFGGHAAGYYVDPRTGRDEEMAALRAEARDWAATAKDCLRLILPLLTNEEREAAQTGAMPHSLVGRRGDGPTTTVTAAQVRDAYAKAMSAPALFAADVLPDGDVWRERERVYTLLAELGITVLVQSDGKAPELISDPNAGCDGCAGCPDCQGIRGREWSSKKTLWARVDALCAEWESHFGGEVDEVARLRAILNEVQS